MHHILEISIAGFSMTLTAVCLWRKSLTLHPTERELADDEPAPAYKTQATKGQFKYDKTHSFSPVTTNFIDLSAAEIHAVFIGLLFLVVLALLVMLFLVAGGKHAS